MLDDYDVSAEVKGGRCSLRKLKEIWITSPYNIHDLFTNLDSVDCTSQLRRIITRIFYCVGRKKSLLKGKVRYSVTMKTSKLILLFSLSKRQ
jgi:hypothetical protein